MPSHILPEGLKVIKFGNTFNYPLFDYRFPNSIEEIWFGDAFNQDITNIKIPYTLRKFVFGEAFNYPLGNVLVRSHSILKEIQFGKNYTRGIVCNTMTDLRYGDKTVKKMLNVLLPVENSNICLVNPQILRKRKINTEITPIERPAQRIMLSNELLPPISNVPNVPTLQDLSILQQYLQYRQRQNGNNNEIQNNN